MIDIALTSDNDHVSVAAAAVAASAAEERGGGKCSVDQGATCTRSGDTIMPGLESEVWELKKIFSESELKESKLKSSKPVMCSFKRVDGCDLFACSQWDRVSGHDPNPWFCCLDHQESYFGGWPKEEKDTPMKVLTEKHCRVIAQNCSAQVNPKMPTSTSIAETVEQNSSEHSATSDDVPSVNPDWLPDTSTAETVEENSSDHSAISNGNGRSSNEAASDDANSNEAQDKNGSMGGKEEGQEGLWDLKTVLSVDQIRRSAITCETPGCVLVACCVWSSSLEPTAPWFSCLDCQESDFGGWPEKREELPFKVLRSDLREAMAEKCTALVEPPMPDLPPGENDSSGNEEGDGEEMWELKRVFGVKELSKSKPIMCSYSNGGECDLVACSKWVCVSGHDPNPWFCCLDHQENDYGGWPEETHEFPVKHLTEQHREAIAERCSAQEDPIMPKLPTSQLLATGGDAEQDNGASAITPPPSRARAVADNNSEVVVGMALFAEEEKPSDNAGDGGNKKRVADDIDGNAQSKRPRLQRGEVFGKSLEVALKDAGEMMKLKKYQLMEKWRKTCIESTHYKETLARQLQTRHKLADLKLQKDQISKLLDATETQMGPEIQRFVIVDRNGLVQRSGEIEKELKLMQEKMDAIEAKVRGLDTEILREIEEQIEGFEERACFDIETPTKIKDQFGRIEF